MKTLWHSHSRLLLLDAVVPHWAGRSGRQDVQEYVHLWTRGQTVSLLYNMAASYCLYCWCKHWLQEFSCTVTGVFTVTSVVPLCHESACWSVKHSAVKGFVGAYCCCHVMIQQSGCAGTHRHHHGDGSSKAPDEGVVHRQPTEVWVPVAFRVQSHRQTCRQTQEHRRGIRQQLLSHIYSITRVCVCVNLFLSWGGFSSEVVR